MSTSNIDRAKVEQHLRRMHLHDSQVGAAADSAMHDPGFYADSDEKTFEGFMATWAQGPGAAFFVQGKKAIAAGGTTPPKRSDYSSGHHGDIDYAKATARFHAAHDE